MIRYYKKEDIDEIAKIIVDDWKIAYKGIIDDKVLEDLKKFIPLGPLHMPANILGVEDITSLTINGGTQNIAIAEDKIVNISSIDISEVM